MRRRFHLGVVAGQLRRSSLADCIRLAMVGLLVATLIGTLPTNGQQPASWLAPANELRDDDELPPLESHAALDAIAMRELAAMLEARCLCPATGSGDTTGLLDDVRAALGTDAVVTDVGLIVGYDRSVAAATTTTIFDPAHQSALLGMRMSQAGIATATIDTRADWLAPPPGGDGPEIDLGGYTVVAIVTAGGDP